MKLKLKIKRAKQDVVPDSWLHISKEFEKILNERALLRMKREGGKEKVENSLLTKVFKNTIKN
jgi:hypothetical protein